MKREEGKRWAQSQKEGSSLNLKWVTPGDKSEAWRMGVKERSRAIDRKWNGNPCIMYHAQNSWKARAGNDFGGHQVPSFITQRRVTIPEREMHCTWSQHWPIGDPAWPSAPRLLGCVASSLLPLIHPPTLSRVEWLHGVRPRNKEPQVAVECNKKPKGGFFLAIRVVLSLAYNGSNQVQSVWVRDRGSLSSAVLVWHIKGADRRTTKSIYLTAMISELDQLCSCAKKLLGRMSLGWPREKKNPGSQRSGLLQPKIAVAS